MTEESKPNARWPGFLAALVFLSSVPLVLGFFGATHPAFDSFSHFRAHLGVATGLLALPLLMTRFRIEGAAAILLAVAATATTIAGTIPSRVTGTAAPVYRILHLNVRFANPDPARVLSLIGSVKPDVATLNEVSGDWLPRLDLLKAAYPYRVICRAQLATRGGFAAVAILSRRPFLAEPGPCLEDGRFAVVSVDFGGSAVDVAALHLDWPWPFDQPAQVNRLVPTLARLSDTAIVAGDFNAVPWSRTVRDLAGRAGFAALPGIGATWLADRLPVALRRWVGLPIDQVLVRGSFEFVQAEIGSDAGSDHAPVVVTFSPPGRPPAGIGSLHAGRNERTIFATR